MKIGYELRKSLGMQFLLDEMAPSTPYGAEHVRQPHFYGPGERHALEQEWANVRAAVEGLAETPEAYDRISHLMMQVRDIRGTLKRCEEMVLTEVELFEVKRFLLQLGLIAPLYKEVGAPYHGIAFTQEAEALRLLDPDGQRTAGFAVSSAYTKTLAHLREEKRQLELTLRNTPEGSTRETLLPTLPYVRESCRPHFI